ncbi:MAG TPA: ABC transporter ATP-binding protein [Bacteroidia bacterium]|nr:MAG: phosphonate-transporting ATPase [Bacteroidetes bacterium OLB10]MBE7508702.1 ABC transporter ATP-binding protein [Bacteroidia bacterium]MBX3106972.1 ABC transporter ATP-binding protein [Bacteroidota bacterium]MCE7955881.1 ABC transporter ATP-binding protein [Bacteroidetes bacterium CHB6]OQB63459.1 MAG: putative ABC transporter ATP-binding protein YxlF [Bacteroidetes bacterium ADurb.Bin141]
MQLSIRSLTKTYPNGVRALNNINLTINNGLFGLLGPNGAGKSSLMRTIATLQDADTGNIFLDDLNVLEQKEEVKKILGYLPQEFGVYPNITAEELLNHIALLKGIAITKERNERVKNLLVQTNLYDVKNKKLGGFSGGMKQRFGIAQALIGNPKIIIVDEPTAGLDPTERNRFLNLLSEISEQVIVILSTHIVEDVKELCSQMAIINKGEVLFSGHPAEALDRVKGKIWSCQVSKQEAKELMQQHQVISQKFNTGQIELHVWSDSNVGNFAPAQPALEDVYFSVLNGFLNKN